MELYCERKPGLHYTTDYPEKGSWAEDTLYSMRYISILLLIIPASLMAQDQCVDGRYMQDPLFSAADIWISPNVPYASAYDQNGVLRDLMLDVYQPATTVDPLEARPLRSWYMEVACLVATRGVSFLYFSVQSWQKRICAASVNYRLAGSNWVPAMATQPVCPGPGTGHNRDVHAAISLSGGEVR